MNIEVNKETLELIKNHRLPSYNEIPNVGLYLEQTAKYINEFLEPVMDTVVTGSMISNYVKKKMVSNPVKKQYYRDQIAKLIIIAVLKSVISLDKVGMLLEKADDNIEKAYDEFCKDFSAALCSVFGTAADAESETGDKLLHTIIVTVAHKIYIDKILVSLEENM